MFRPAMAVTARASDSPASSTNEGFQNTSNSLYLFTFLATLFLLVLITSSIVLRSLIIRARFRVQQEVSIAQGVPPEQESRSTHRRKHRLGKKPKLYDTWIFPGERDESVHQWHGMMPLGAQVIKDPIRKARIARERLMAARLQQSLLKTPADTRKIVQVSVLIALPRPANPPCVRKWRKSPLALFVSRWNSKTRRNISAIFVYYLGITMAGPLLIS
ncbi:hypothetical protein BDZ89DRAFT_659002 [Hymenopellis radicata]|nr:hypothetical protein BDZ89DRAFT_659002 [Hymenopellis radicata]